MKKILFIVLLILLPMQVSAESLTLDQLLVQSLQKNTNIYHVQREREDKLATALDVKTLDNPELNTDIIHQKGAQGVGINLELTQPLKYSQISGARLDYADALTAVADVEEKYEVLKIINQTTALYMQAWLLVERKKLYENYNADAQQMKKLMSISTKQGQTSPAAYHLFAGDAARLASDIKAREAELQSIYTELTKISGKNYKAATLVAPIFKPIPDDVDRLERFSMAHSNVRNVIKSHMAAARYRLKVAEQDAAWPAIGPRLLYARSANGDESSYGVGIALQIPLWNHHEAERDRAQAELRQAEAEKNRWDEISAQEFIRQLQQHAVLLQNRAEAYRQNILPEYRQSYELMQKMLRQGQVNAVEAWQVREKLLSAENEALEAVVQAINARGALELELGGKIEEIQ